MKTTNVNAEQLCKHGEVIKAYLNGAIVEQFNGTYWYECKHPHWGISSKYRVSPWTREQLEKHENVIRAWERGETIQCQIVAGGSWHTLVNVNNPDGVKVAFGRNSNYRIKPVEQFEPGGIKLEDCPPPGWDIKEDGVSVFDMDYENLRRVYNKLKRIPWVSENILLDIRLRLNNMRKEKVRHSVMCAPNAVASELIEALVLAGTAVATARGCSSILKDTLHAKTGRARQPESLSTLAWKMAVCKCPKEHARLQKQFDAMAAATGRTECKPIEPKAETCELRTPAPVAKGTFFTEPYGVFCELSFNELQPEQKLDLLRKEVTKLCKKGKAPDVKLILGFFGAQRLGDLAPMWFDAVAENLHLYIIGELKPEVSVTPFYCKTHKIAVPFQDLTKNGKRDALSRMREKLSEKGLEDTLKHTLVKFVNYGEPLNLASVDPENYARVYNLFTGLAEKKQIHVDRYGAKDVYFFDLTSEKQRAELVRLTNNLNRMANAAEGIKALLKSLGVSNVSFLQPHLYRAYAIGLHPLLLKYNMYV